MRTNKLAVYGTLRDGKRDTWKVDGYSLVYEGISSGLYERRIVNAYNNDEEVEAWMYTIGSALMQGSGVFEMVPKKDWMSKECLKLRT